MFGQFCPSLPSLSPVLDLADLAKALALAGQSTRLQALTWRAIIGGLLRSDVVMLAMLAMFEMVALW